MSGQHQVVVIELRIQMLRSVPLDWDAHDVEFWLNDSSHCLSTEIDELAQWDEKASEHGCCDSCGRTKGFFVRVATEADLENLKPVRL